MNISNFKLKLGEGGDILENIYTQYLIIMIIVFFSSKFSVILNTFPLKCIYLYSKVFVCWIGFVLKKIYTPLSTEKYVKLFGDAGD